MFLIICIERLLHISSHFSLRKWRRQPHFPTKSAAAALFSYKIGGGGKDLAILLAAVLTWSGYWMEDMLRECGARVSSANFARYLQSYRARVGEAAAAGDGGEEGASERWGPGCRREGEGDVGGCGQRETDGSETEALPPVLHLQGVGSRGGGATAVSSEWPIPGQKKKGPTARRPLRVRWYKAWRVALRGQVTIRCRALALNCCLHSSSTLERKTLVSVESALRWDATVFWS